MYDVDSIVERMDYLGTREKAGPDVGGPRGSIVQLQHSRFAACLWAATLPKYLLLYINNTCMYSSRHIHCCTK